VVEPLPDRQPRRPAGALALALGDDYYFKLAADYGERRRQIVSALQGAGFRCYVPRGAYYVMTDISGFGLGDDLSFCRYLMETLALAAVPGSSFYRDPADGRTQLRFTFCKSEKTFQAAAERLARLPAARA